MNEKEMANNLGKAYNMISTIPVVNVHVETMCAAKKLISDVYEALISETKEGVVANGG